MSDLAPYEVYDGATLTTIPLELPYIIGTNANLAILGSWPPMTSMPPMALPTPAKHLKLRCSQNCLVRLASLDLTVAQASGGYPAGLPVQIYLNAGQLYEINFPAIIIYYIRDTVNGILHVHAYA